ncbi:MAG: 23S rRNA (uracil(1939)-C(5))-methyltransferase RlmD, partial [Lachnospiraceae bacterium]|nr:23S rRNA (uracil(1939)-C(5))-methyltransferase RlmD [Lachnospiraceae bacterium]
DIGSSGEGIGHFEGMTYFVNGAIPGDIVRAGITKLKKTYGYARVIEIESPSEDRVEPVCPVAGRCGGCQIMQMDYEAQLGWKASSVREKLSRIGGFSDEKLDEMMKPIIGMEVPYQFRNKAQYPVGSDRDGNTIMGFFAGHSHRIVTSEKCYLGGGINEMIRGAVTGCDEVVPYNEETHKGLLRHVMVRASYHYEDVMVVLVVNASGMTRDVREMTEALVPRLSGLSYNDDSEVGFGVSRVLSIVVNYNDRPGNVIMGEKCETVYGETYLRDRIGEVEFCVSALSFFQVNPRQTKKLYDKALEYAALTGRETVWDLYCGIGTISLYMARNAALVYGVEVIEDAISDARRNAKSNGFNNAFFAVGDAGKVEVKDEWSEMPDAEGRLGLPRPDVIVVDPPRKGCDEKLIATILKARPDRIVYVSCDPATLARDLKLLCADGYDLAAVTPVDQFGHSVHCETVCFLSKNYNINYR